MKITIYLVVTTLFAIWISLIVRAIRKMSEVRQNGGFGDCQTYYNIKQYAADRSTEENLKVLNDFKAFRKRQLLLWFLSLLTSFIIVSIIGIISSVWLPN